MEEKNNENEMKERKIKGKCYCIESNRSIGLCANHTSDGILCWK